MKFLETFWGIREIKIQSWSLKLLSQSSAYFTQPPKVQRLQQPAAAPATLITSQWKMVPSHFFFFFYILFMTARPQKNIFKDCICQIDIKRASDPAPIRGFKPNSLWNHPAVRTIAMHHAERKCDLTTRRWGAGEVLYNKITNWWVSIKLYEAFMCVCLYVCLLL